MDQNINQSASTRRFIFSDEFYDDLEAKAPLEEKVSFDVPKINPNVEMPQEVPKEIIEEKPIINDTPSFFNNDQTNNIEIKPEEELQEIEMPSFNFQKVEEKTVEPVIEPQPIEQPVIDQPKPPEEVTNIEIPKMEEVVLPRVEEVPLETSDLQPISQTNPNNVVNEELNVETGINTELEKELMKAKVAMETKIPVVENNVWLKPEQEKVVYRATRRATPKNINMFPEETNEPSRVVTPSVSPLFQPSNISITEKDINPQIINIDEEIRKEIEIQESIDNAEVNIIVEENDDVDLPVIKSNLLEELLQKERQTGKTSILAHYGEDFCSRDYVTNPAIGRNEEIKQLILILLTPEKSGILVGKPGIGKTSIVEGLAYRLQRGKVPDALKGYRVVSVKTTSLIGNLPTGETKLQTLIDELKDLDKIILFIDEIHMLMGATNESSLDFANMFKESLGRGSIKMIGATTNDEYERYVLRDKAFVRRFQRVDVEEPTREQTIKILVGTLPKIEKNTGAKLKYTDYIKTEIMSFIVDITTEYKRVYGIGSRYPDICLTLLAQAFSQAVFENRSEVNIFDIRKAIENSKNIYPDVIEKELVNFDNKFRQIINEEKAM